MWEQLLKAVLCGLSPTLMFVADVGQKQVRELPAHSSLNERPLQNKFTGMR